MTATQRLVITAFTLTAAVANSPAAQITTTWSGGAGTWNTPAKWDNGVPNNGANTYTVRIDNGNSTVSPVTLDISPTIDNLTISAGDSLAISNGVSFTVTSGAGAGTITNA
ncbi:MAG TPA: hypothetical protein VMV81_10915, partial [Phycisphaerae bacterium]|nr:hypothetical protein [Phycisphaerae bacterium]